MSRSLGHFSRVINPSCPYPCINERVARVVQILYFRLFFSYDLHMQIIRNVHKIIIKQNSWHIWKTLLTKIELGVQGYQCQTRSVKSNNQTFTKFMTNLSRGEYKTNLLLDKMTKARLSAAFQRSCPTRHTCSAKYQEVLTNYQMEHFDHVSLLLLDQNF